MEEVLIALLGIVVEILVEALAYLPWDLLLWMIERRRREPGEPFERPLVGVAVFGAMLGLALGGLSLLVRRQTMLPYPWLRISNLVVAPILSGFLALGSAERRSERGEPSSPRHHFVFAFALTLLLTVVRFAYGVRPK